MKKSLLVAFALLAMSLIAGMASATHIEDFTPSVDCEGWTVFFGVRYVSVTASADINYTVVLLDEAGNEITQFSGAETLTADGVNQYAEYSYEGLWGLDLCGTYTANVTLNLSPDYASWYETQTASATFVCECPTEACNFTPGFWKNHPEDWPVMDLTLGDMTYTQSELLDIMDTPVRGDATIILVYHLIAAKLNVLSGSDASISDTISAADDFLMQYPLFSNPRGAARQDAIAYKSTMADYNELGCGEEMDDGHDKTFAPADEDASWGSVKSLYR